VTVLVLTTDGLREALSAPGQGGFPTFGPALDLVIVMPISWLPLVADYTRYARGSRSAFTGTFLGYLVANVWLYALGILLVLGVGAAPSPEGIAAGILAVAGGSLAGVMFLVGLLVGETDEAFADIYSGAVSLQNIFSRVPQRALIAGVAGAGTVLAAWLTMDRYENFLFLIGSVFVPLFGILAADYFIVRRGHIDPGSLFRDHGDYWYTGGIRIGAFGAWIAGFIVYHWIIPTGPEWWTTPVTDLLGTPLSERADWLPASLPSFAVAFLLTLVLPRLSFGRSRGRGDDEDPGDLQHVRSNVPVGTDRP
jgi:NCS1 family nucleobase:cation symporter-1